MSNLNFLEIVLINVNNLFYTFIFLFSNNILRQKKYIAYMILRLLCVVVFKSVSTYDIESVS